MPERAVLRHAPEGSRSRRRIRARAGAPKLIDRCRPFRSGWGDTGVCKKSVNELRRRHRVGVSIGKACARDKLRRKGLLVRFQFRLPGAHAHHYVLPDQLRVRQKFIQPERNRGAGQVAVSSFVKLVDQVASLLKLDRQKERRGDIYALDLDALRVGLAGSNFVYPKREAARVRLATEKIAIVLGHKELRIVNLVCRQRSQREPRQCQVHRVVSPRKD